MNKHAKTKYGWVIVGLFGISEGLVFETETEGPIGYVKDIRKAKVYKLKRLAFENCISMRFLED